MTNVYTWIQQSNQDIEHFHCHKNVLFYPLLVYSPAPPIGNCFSDFYLFRFVSPMIELQNQNHAIIITVSLTFKTKCNFSHSCMFLQISVVFSFWLLSSSPCMGIWWMFTFSCWWIGGYFSMFFFYEYSYHENFCTNLCIDTGFIFLGKMSRRGISDHMVIICSLTKLYHFTLPQNI